MVQSIKYLTLDLSSGLDLSDHPVWNLFKKKKNYKQRQVTNEVTIVIKGLID